MPEWLWWACVVLAWGACGVFACWAWFLILREIARGARWLLRRGRR